MKKYFWTQTEIETYINKLNQFSTRNVVKVDLHTHTTGSDGSDSPLMLLFRAHRLGLKTISITDHNTIRGYKRLQEQLDEIIRKYEDAVANHDISKQRKDQIRKGAKKLYRLLNEVAIIPGCEIQTFYKGCPYVEILAYDIDIGILDDKLRKAFQGVEQPGDVLAKGLKENARKLGLTIDDFFVDNRSDYRRLFYHELIKHPENAKFYIGIEGDSEENQSRNFAKKYLDNHESDFYVNLNNPSTRKKAMIKMIESHSELVFDTAIIQNAGGAAGQFYVELMKHPENRQIVDPKITTCKAFIYFGIYNQSSQFYVDLSSTKPSLQSVIDIIHEAGGKAMIAHWGRYKLCNAMLFDWTHPEGKANLEELIDCCDGAECIYPDNPIDLQRIIYSMCVEKAKCISIGGDNHGRISNEGRQYQLGSQIAREVDELKWIHESVEHGKEFISVLEGIYHFKRRLEEVMNE